MFPELTIVKAPLEAEKLNWQGNFAKKIVVLANKNAASDGEIAYLQKILTAAKLSFSDDILFATIGEDESIAAVAFLKNQQTQKLLLFGLKPQQIGLNIDFPKYQIAEFYGFSILAADSLAEIPLDEGKRKGLWVGVQALFL